MAEQPRGSSPQTEDQPDPATARPGRPDLAIGAFTPHGPWTVDPEQMTWRLGGPQAGAADGDSPDSDELDIDELRKQAADLARQLVRPRRFPPGLRVIDVGLRLGIALVGWGIRDRGTPTSRSGLSR